MTTTFRIHEGTLLYGRQRLIPPEPLSPSSTSSVVDTMEAERIKWVWNSTMGRPTLMRSYEHNGLTQCLALRTFPSREEALSWAPRMRMFWEAMGPRYNACTQLLSISVLPVHPGELQTLYYRHVFLDPALRGSCPLHNQNILFRCSHLPASPSAWTPPPVLRGFLKPYPTFSCKDFKPEVNPDELPPEVSRHVIRSQEDIDLAIADIFSETFRARMKVIVGHFLEDLYAKGLYVTSVQPAYTPDTPLKKKYFVKA